MEYRKRYQPQPGFTQLVAPGDGGLTLTSFGIINLTKGETCEAETGEMEVVLIILGGKCSVRGDGFDFPNLGERADVFSGKPYTIYIPCGKKYSVTADSDVQLAWTAAPSTLSADAYVIRPEQVKEAHIGKENYQRDAYLILTDATPSAHFFIGEAFVPSGNHASYPPHRHDFDNLPTEVDMEEIYFFRFNPEQGYGLQTLYTDDRAIDCACRVEQNDVTLLPRGYHPVTCAPGYTMYYLWIMAGKVNRKFLSVIDPTHQWLTGK
jgi:5-deoxy-glucuronate isomerase